MSKMWGVHNDTLTTELVDDGFVSIGWDELGDLTQVGGREEFKAALAGSFPDAKPRAVANWAGVLHRFAYEMQPGDVVVAPYKPDGTINIGVVAGPYRFEASAPTHRHRREVTWHQTGIARTIFTQPALYEVGAFLTVFGIRRYAAEFQAVLEASGQSVDVVSRAAEAASESEPDTTYEPRASRIARHTRDFVLGRLTGSLTPRDLEEFVADLLRAMGYQARVTQYSQDGGVDVIAHRDPLGVEPPLIKVQVKQRIGAIGAPEVHQLMGTHSRDELSVFVTLGAYSRDAVGIERSREGLRLISGEQLVDLVLEHYDRLDQTWRTRIPLTPVLVVDDSADV